MKTQGIYMVYTTQNLANIYVITCIQKNKHYIHRPDSRTSSTSSQIVPGTSTGVIYICIYVYIGVHVGIYDQVCIGKIYMIVLRMYICTLIAYTLHILKYIHTYIHTYIYTYIHACMHTYTCIHTHVYNILIQHFTIYLRINDDTTSTHLVPVERLQLQLGRNFVLSMQSVRYRRRCREGGQYINIIYTIISINTCCICTVRVGVIQYLQYESLMCIIDVVLCHFVEEDWLREVLGHLKKRQRKRVLLGQRVD